MSIFQVTWCETGDYPAFDEFIVFADNLMDVHSQFVKHCDKYDDDTDDPTIFSYYPICLPEKIRDRDNGEMANPMRDFNNFEVGPNDDSCEYTCYIQGHRLSIKRLPKDRSVIYISGSSGG